MLILNPKTANLEGNGKLVRGCNMMTDIWGDEPKTRKGKKRATLQESKITGKAAEEIIKSKYELYGYSVKRTPKGKDYDVVLRNPVTSRVIEHKQIEVKSGKAKLSPLQKETQKQHRGSYKVERVSKEDTIFNRW
jgi:hypothetical protein